MDEKKEQVYKRNALKFRGKFQEACQWNWNRPYWTCMPSYGYKSACHCNCDVCVKCQKENNLERCTKEKRCEACLKRAKEKENDQIN